MSGASRPAIDDDDLHRFVDGHLEPRRQAEVEAWLAAHPDVAARVAADRDVRRLLRERLAPIAREPIPARLRVASLSPRPTAGVPARRSWWPIAAAAVLCLVLGGLVGWMSRAVVRKEPVFALADPATLEAVQAFRTFVPEVVHPVEVKADQKPHLIQWLSNRLGQPAEVPDLTAQGFRLMGGRVVPTEGRPASLLMYDDDQKNRLTLFSRVAGGDERTSFRFAREGDVSAFSWIAGGLTHVVTARLPEARLLAVSEAIDAQLRASAEGKR